jgi:hypothetical protein
MSVVVHSVYPPISHRHSIYKLTFLSQDLILLGVECLRIPAREGKGELSSGESARIVYGFTCVKTILPGRFSLLVYEWLYSWCCCVTATGTTIR